MRRKKEHVKKKNLMYLTIILERARIARLKHHPSL